MADRDQSKSKHAGRVKDFRGRAVTLIDPFVMHKLRRYDTIPADSLSRIVFSYVWSMALVILTAAHFLKWGGGYPVNPRELRLWIVLLSIFVVNCGLVWYFSRRTRLKRVCRILLQYLRCPHCGYDLRMLPTDVADGATVCPECGSAWQFVNKENRP